MATKERIIIEQLLRVVDKETGNDIDFTLNPAQAAVDASLTGRDVIPKARQEGVSTYFLARNLVQCLSQRNVRAVVISHDVKATQKMLERVHYFIDTMRCPRPEIKNSSKNELTFPKMNSAFYVGTAGSRQFGRGDTITHLHCSEVAFWPDPKSLTAGLFQAVPRSGQISIESTGNGVGNWYHKLCMNASAGRGKYHLHFLDWLGFPEYRNELTAEGTQYILNTLNADLEEDTLIRDYGATPGQIAWRRDKLEELDYDLRLFKQEYPATLDECFQASGHSIFNKVNYAPSKDWKKVDANLSALGEHPNKNYDYMISCDVGAGVDRANSVAQIICLQTGEQVGEWVSNKLAPDVFGVHVVRLARVYRNAYVNVESNNHGIVTLAKIKALYQSSKIARYRPKVATGTDPVTILGHPTNTRTKPMMIGRLRSLLAAPRHGVDESFLLHSPQAASELSTFVEKDDGKLEAEEGCKDDRVMALAVGAVTITRAALQVENRLPAPHEVQDPFAMGGIINELRGRDSGGYPIMSQTAIEYEDTGT